MKSKLEYTTSTERQYQSWLIATLIHNRKRHQMTWASTNALDYSAAVAIATPSIEKWEAVILAQVEDAA